MKKKLKNGNQPATQKDLALWAGQIMYLMGKRIDGVEKRLGKRINKLELRMDQLETRMGQLSRAMESILIVINSIDGRLKEWADLPERVERLEDKILLHRR